MSEAEHEQLCSIARSRSMAAALTQRAQIVLACAAGDANSRVARHFRVTQATERRWRRRYVQHRLQGLYDEARPGRARTIEDERIATLINKTLQKKPKSGATHWSVREAAAENGISKTSVHRYFQAFGLQPHRTESFKLSTDPFFIEKLRDVVGLYLSRPENALVLCADEKIQCQALERTQPMLPLGLGYVEGMTHDYKRHGTTRLFAALDVFNGKIVAECKARHRHQEFLDFLRRIDHTVPQKLDIHLIVDNYSTHKHARVKSWLVKRPRWHIHFIPTYSSWLNLVGRFFALITDKTIRRGSFTSVKDLIGKIDHFVTGYNKHCKPLTWTATADSILQKLEQLTSRISGTGH